MKSEVVKSITKLEQILKYLNFHSMTLAETKDCLKNKDDVSVTILKLLFDSLQYLKLSELRKCIADDLFDSFSTESICCYLADELNSFG